MYNISWSRHQHRILNYYRIFYYLDKNTIISFNFVQNRTDISKESSRYVGAWWIGYVIGGGLSFIIAVVLCAFPSELPGKCNLCLMGYRTLFRFVLSDVMQ